MVCYQREAASLRFPAGFVVSVKHLEASWIVEGLVTEPHTACLTTWLSDVLPVYYLAYRLSVSLNICLTTCLTTCLSVLQ